MNVVLPRRLKKSILMLMGCSAALVPAASAQAQAHTHDGFFLQMDLGVGAMASTLDGGGGEVKASGGAGEFSIAVGGAIRENFILAGHVWAVSVDEPDIEVNGRDFGASDSTLTLSGLGVNATYYLPSNVYFSATPSMTTLEVESDDGVGETDTGFGLRLAVGKEWWVSDNWGLGLNGQAVWSSNEDEGDTWSTLWFGIAFSATFN